MFTNAFKSFAYVPYSISLQFADYQYIMKFDARCRAKSHCQALQFASNCPVISVTLPSNMTEMTARFDADYKII